MYWLALVIASVSFLELILGAVLGIARAVPAAPDWTKPAALFRMPLAPSPAGFAEGHQIVAFLLAFLTVALAIAVLVREDREWVKLLAVVAVLVVLADVALGILAIFDFAGGALTAAHSLTAQIFFCITVSLAVFTSPKWRWEGSKIEPARLRPLRWGALAFSIVVLAETVFGAINLDVSLNPLAGDGCARSIGIAPHIVLGAAVLVCVLYLLVRALEVQPRDPAQLLPVIGLVTLVLIQLFLGVGVYMMIHFSGGVVRLIAPIAIAMVAHLALGALVLAGSVVTTCLAYRDLARPGVLMTPLAATQASQ